MDQGTWDKLKSACSNSSPAGENCEYQPEFLELMDEAAPRAEVQMGTTVIAARLPDWPAIAQMSMAISQRTRDLRVGVLLTESLAQLHHWSGLAEGLEILWCWTTQLWPSVWPELDRDEQDDPTARLSALAHLLSDQFLQRTLYHLPLAEHAALGTLRLRDTITILKGKREVARELTAAEIEAFFAETSALELALRLREMDRCCAALEALDEFLNDQPGTQEWSATRLLELLRRGRELLSKHLSQHRMLDTIPSAADADQPASSATNAILDSARQTTANVAIPLVSFHASPSPSNQEPATALSPAVAMPASEPSLERGPALPIRSRDEATAAIDAVSQYFQIHEPASPVPLLLQRAKRLISMNFVELMHELAPNEAMQLLRQLHVVDKAG